MASGIKTGNVRSLCGKLQSGPRGPSFFPVSLLLVWTLGINSAPVSSGFQLGPVSGESVYFPGSSLAGYFPVDVMAPLKATSTTRLPLGGGQNNSPSKISMLYSLEPVHTLLYMTKEN